MSNDHWAWCRFLKIKEYSQGMKLYTHRKHGGLQIGHRVLIAKKRPRFKIIGSPFWAHYTPKTISEAMSAGMILDYYFKQLASEKSADNPLREGMTLEEWKDARNCEGITRTYFVRFEELIEEYYEDMQHL